jgi:creatinine amidohydrolase
MPLVSWLDLTWQDFRDRDMARAVAVLPVAAVEQHGPHLPVGVDTRIADGYLAALAPLVPDDLDALLLPVQAVGKSDEHEAYPGTLTLSAETALRAWTEIGASVARAGCRRLVIVSSHGGNNALIEIVAGELRRRHGMLAVVTAWARLGTPPGLFSAEELRHGIHAGAIETALMRRLHPESVRERRAAAFEPRTVAMERELSYLRAGRPAGFGWMAQDLHPSGAMGDATRGSAEDGSALLAHGARAFAALLAEVAHFDLDASAGPGDGA